MTVTFLIGGARSGKSSLAIELATRSELPVTFIATAPLPGADDDMVERIERHRAEHPSRWSTIEEPLDLIGALDHAVGAFVIIDCLTLWVSNLMWEGRSDADIDDVAIAASTFASARTTPVVVVSNETGMGVHPDNSLGRRYRDVLGRVNQRWADAADNALLVVAGRVLRLERPSAVTR